MFKIIIVNEYLLVHVFFSFLAKKEEYMPAIYMIGRINAKIFISFDPSDGLNDADTIDWICLQAEVSHFSTRNQGHLILTKVVLPFLYGKICDVFNIVCVLAF